MEGKVTPVNNWDNVVEDLIRDEGLRLKAYQDTEGVWTIGFGHTGPEVYEGLRWTVEQARTVLYTNIDTAVEELDKALPWWRTLNPPRQDVLVNMMYNLGTRRLLQFKNTLHAIHQGQFHTAAEEMLESRWAKQVKGRATRLAHQMRTGERDE